MRRVGRYGDGDDENSVVGEMSFWALVRQSRAVVTCASIYNEISKIHYIKVH
jgi:hypothetical protein